MAYDSECEKLARHFLEGKPRPDAARTELAQHIQDAVETWFAVFDTGWGGEERRVGEYNRRSREDEEAAHAGGYRRHGAGGTPWTHDRRKA